MRSRISVKSIAPSKYQVAVEQGGTKTLHEVTVSAGELQRYGKGATAERLLEVSFEFLLQHEAKESILSRFQLSDIEAYFPEYPKRVFALL